MEVRDAIAAADLLLPGTPSPDHVRDPRWQAIIAVAEYLPTDAETIWPFILRWGQHESEDVRAAIATCLLEHLLESHFAQFFPRVRDAVLENQHFAETFLMCWKFGEAETSGNSEQFDELGLAVRARWKMV